MASKTSNPCKDNHYVPQAYLRSWGNDALQIYVYRLLVSNPNVPVWREIYIKSLAKRQHLYTRLEGANESDEMERWFNDDFEVPAQVAISKAQRDCQLSPEDWANLIRYLAAQDARTPAQLIKSIKRWNDSLQETLDNVLVEAVSDLTEAGRTGRKVRDVPSANPTGFPAMVSIEPVPDSDKVGIQVKAITGRALWLFSLRHVLTETVRVLLTHRWTILRMPEGMTFLTSDNPVVKLNYSGPGEYNLGGGWGSIGTEIFFPLGPHHAMYARIGSKPPARGTRLDVAIAREFQKFTVENAHRFVFASSADPLVPVLRPRHADEHAYKHEDAQWAQWHDEQSQAERNLGTN